MHISLRFVLKMQGAFQEKILCEVMNVLFLILLISTKLTLHPLYFPLAIGKTQPSAELYWYDFTQIMPK